MPAASGWPGASRNTTSTWPTGIARPPATRRRSTESPSLEITLDLADALFDAGYTLHIDAAVEEMRDSPNEIAVPLTAAGAGQPVKGRRYIASFRYDM